LTRKLIWANIYDDVRDAKLAGPVYIKFVLKQLPYENNENLVGNMVTYSSVCLSMTPKKFKPALKQ